MEKRILGRSGLSVGVLALGTVKIGRVQGVKYPDPQRLAALPSDADVRALLAAAHSLGVNLLDTAPAYGESERRLGEALTPQPTGRMGAPHNARARVPGSDRGGGGGGDGEGEGGRDDWLLCTKVGEEFSPTPDGTGTSVFDFSEHAARRSIERSLRNLRTDRLDVVLLHSPGEHAFPSGEADLFETGAWRALLNLRSRGTVRAIGASVKSLSGALSAVELGDAVMLPFSPTRRECAAAIARAHARGVGVLVKQALDSGHAADIPAALRFVLETPGVSCVVVGTARPDHLRANALAISA